MVVGSQGMGALGAAQLVGTALLYARCPVATFIPVMARLPTPWCSVASTDRRHLSGNGPSFDRSPAEGVDLSGVTRLDDLGMFPVLGISWREREEERG